VDKKGTRAHTANIPVTRENAIINSEAFLSNLNERETAQFIATRKETKRVSFSNQVRGLRLHVVGGEFLIRRERIEQEIEFLLVVVVGGVHGVGVVVGGGGL